MLTQLIGFLGLLIQVVLFVFLQERPGTRWIVLSFGVFAVLPVLALAPLEHLLKSSDARGKDLDQHSIAEMRGSDGAAVYAQSQLRSCTPNSGVTLGPGGL